MIIAKISFKEKDITSFARSFGKKVVLLDVKKRGGKNLIQASQKIRKLVGELGQNHFPKDLTIKLSNDQSTITLNQVSDLVNNIIFGVILVVVVLMFFLGFRNALFVGFAIPMSMFMSFMIMSLLGYTMNTMVSIWIGNGSWNAGGQWNCGRRKRLSFDGERRNEQN